MTMIGELRYELTVIQKVKVSLCHCQNCFLYRQISRTMGMFIFPAISGSFKYKLKPFVLQFEKRCIQLMETQTPVSQILNVWCLNCFMVHSNLTSSMAIWNLLCGININNKTVYSRKIYCIYNDFSCIRTG